MGDEGLAAAMQHVAASGAEVEFGVTAVLQGAAEPVALCFTPSAFFVCSAQGVATVPYEQLQRVHVTRAYQPSVIVRAQLDGAMQQWQLLDTAHDAVGNLLEHHWKHKPLAPDTIALMKTFKGVATPLVTPQASAEPQAPEEVVVAAAATDEPQDAADNPQPMDTAAESPAMEFVQPHTPSNERLENMFVGFSRTVKCVSAEVVGKQDLADKCMISLHASLLESLVENDAASKPWCFELYNPISMRRIAVGVQDFTAQAPSIAYVPNAVLDAVDLDDCEQGVLHLLQVPKGERVQLQPLTWTWLDIPRHQREATLRQRLESLQVLTEGTELSVMYDGTEFKFLITQCLPLPCICIVNVDLETDITEPAGSNPAEDPSQTALSLGQTVRLGLEVGETKFFTLRPKLGSMLPSQMKITLHVTRGDADLYVSQTDSTPQQSNYLVCDQNFGSAELVVGPHVSRWVPWHLTTNTLFLGVSSFCEDGAEFELTVVPATGPVKPTAAREELPRATRPKLAAGHQLCETCEKPIPKQQFLSHQRHCAAHSFKCPSCHVVMPRTQRQKHQAIFHEQLQCACGMKMSQLELEDHRFKKCRLRLVPCPNAWCKRNFRTDALASHATRCDMETSFCPECGSEFRCKDMLNHLEFHHGIDVSQVDMALPLSEQKLAKASGMQQLEALVRRCEAAGQDEVIERLDEAQVTSLEKVLSAAAFFVSNVESDALQRSSSLECEQKSSQPGVSNLLQRFLAACEKERFSANVRRLKKAIDSGVFTWLKNRFTSALEPCDWTCAWGLTSTLGGLMESLAELGIPVLAATIPENCSKSLWLRQTAVTQVERYIAEHLSSEESNLSVHIAAHVNALLDSNSSLVDKAALAQDLDLLVALAMFVPFKDELELRLRQRFSFRLTQGRCRDAAFEVEVAQRLSEVFGPDYLTWLRGMLSEQQWSDKLSAAVVAASDGDQPLLSVSVFSSDRWPIKHGLLDARCHLPVEVQRCMDAFVMSHRSATFLENPPFSTGNETSAVYNLVIKHKDSAKKTTFSFGAIQANPLASISAVLSWIGSNWELDETKNLVIMGPPQPGVRGQLVRITPDSTPFEHLFAPKDNIRVLTTHCGKPKPGSTKMPAQTLASSLRARSLHAPSFICSTGNTRLVWAYSQGYVELEFAKAACTLFVSPHQALVLMCFNDRDSVTIGTLMEETGLDPYALRLAVPALLAEDHKLLTCQSRTFQTSGDFLPRDRLSFNTKFSAQDRSEIRVHATNTHHLDSRELARARGERAATIDAAIVRCLKHGTGAAATPKPTPISVDELASRVQQVCRRRFHVTTQALHARCQWLAQQHYVRFLEADMIMLNPSNTPLDDFVAVEEPALSRISSLPRTASIAEIQPTGVSLARSLSLQHPATPDMDPASPMSWSELLRQPTCADTVETQTTVQRHMHPQHLRKAMVAPATATTQQVLVSELKDTLAQISERLDVSHCDALSLLADSRANWDPVLVYDLYLHDNSYRNIVARADPVSMRCCMRAADLCPTGDDEDRSTMTLWCGHVVHLYCLREALTGMLKSREAAGQFCVAMDEEGHSVCDRTIPWLDLFANNFFGEDNDKFHEEFLYELVGKQIQESANLALCPKCGVVVAVDPPPTSFSRTVRCPECANTFCFKCIGSWFEDHRPALCEQVSELADTLMASGAVGADGEDMLSFRAIIASTMSCPRCKQRIHKEADTCQLMICGANHDDKDAQWRGKGCGFRFCTECLGDYKKTGCAAYVCKRPRRASQVRAQLRRIKDTSERYLKEVPSQEEVQLLRQRAAQHWSSATQSPTRVLIPAVEVYVQARKALAYSFAYTRSFPRNPQPEGIEPGSQEAEHFQCVVQTKSAAFAQWQSQMRETTKQLRKCIKDLLDKSASKLPHPGGSWAEKSKSTTVTYNHLGQLQLDTKLQKFNGDWQACTTCFAEGDEFSNKNGQLRLEKFKRASIHRHALKLHDNPQEWACNSTVQCSNSHQICRSRFVCVDASCGLTLCEPCSLSHLGQLRGLEETSETQALVRQHFVAKQTLVSFLRAFEDTVFSEHTEQDTPMEDAPEEEPPAPAEAEALIPCEVCDRLVNGWDMFIAHMLEEHPREAERLQLF